MLLIIPSACHLHARAFPQPRSQERLLVLPPLAAEDWKKRDPGNPPMINTFLNLCMIASQKPINFAMSSHISQPYLIFIMWETRDHLLAVPTLLDIYHVGNQGSFVSCVILMRPNKHETTVHSCWLFFFW